ncbi:hypothetical protein GCM10027413_15280 [Conyzicola nivalis]|uniref:Uncharacterized protein n=1 Tax=Conyzicola nivalis TaxID=1477021 RepID=A0A916SGY5_9MICO|nr:hypothetical protein [Conyzicola nivalis]GGA98567.1 hypothetical protein GCM10010979_11340 [Conyzicola nivalis]
MRRGLFGARQAPGEPEAGPAESIAARARAAQARESAETRRTAKRSGEAARLALIRTVEQNERELELALDTVVRFEPTTLGFLATEIDSADPITQWSTLGRSPVPDAGLPGWLRDRCLTANSESVVLDWLTFRAVFRAHKEFSARGTDDPLPQIYEALSLQPGESLAVEGVLTAGRRECDRILRVALALRTAQRAAVARDIRSLTGYAAADAWHAFDRANRFVTAQLAEWLVAEDPADGEVAAQVAAGRFSTDEFTATGRSTGIAPYDIDEAAFAADLRRTTPST